MKNRTENNRINLLEKFKKSIQENEKSINPKYESYDDSILQTLLTQYKYDAFDILINKGFKINYSEYKKLEKACNKIEMKEMYMSDIYLTKIKYEHTLIYLIEIGCAEELKTFKKIFLERLHSKLMRNYTTENLYDADTGCYVGVRTYSGKILIHRPGSTKVVSKSELSKIQRENNYKNSRKNRPLKNSFS